MKTFYGTKINNQSEEKRKKKLNTRITPLKQQRANKLKFISEHDVEPNTKVFMVFHTEMEGNNFSMFSPFFSSSSFVAGELIKIDGCW